MGMKFLDAEYDDIEDIRPEFKNLVIIDALNLAFRFKHKMPSEIPYVYAGKYVNTVYSFARSYKANKIVIAADAGHKFRSDMYPEYKMNRKEKYKDQTDVEHQDFTNWYKEYNKALELCKTNKDFLVLQCKGVEADDLAAMTVCKFADFFPEVWLVSTDSDWDLILQDNVQRFSFVTRKIYSSSSILADKGLTIDQLVSLKVLKGDAKDNITGIEGVGDKRAAALIDEYGSALDILDAIPLQGDNKYIQNVNNSAHIIERNYKLIDLVSFHEENIGEHMNSVSKDLEVYLNVDN